MTTITIAELKQLRQEYAPETPEAYAARINALDWPEDRKVKAIERNRKSAESNAARLAAFDKVMAYLDKTSSLPPDFNGGSLMKADLWNGALSLVRMSPDEYRITVPQYGCGTVYVRL